MTAEIVKAQPAPSLPDMVRYAEHLAGANLLPGQYRKQPANVLYAMEYGRTLGITPLAAITGIHVIEGKPSASAALISGLVRRAGHKLRVRGNDTEAWAQIVRSDDPDYEGYQVTWTLDRARQAGLANKDVWRKYPAAMLKARAITEVARDACEEVLFGLHYTPEELGASVDADGVPVEAPEREVRRVQSGEPDPWATPASDAGPPQSPPVRDYLAEARRAGTAEEVREIYLAAGADPSAPPELARELAEIGRSKPAPPAPASAGDPVDVEAVEEPADEHAQAVTALRAAAHAAGLPDVDTEFEASYGLPPERAATAKVREMTGLISSAA